MDVVRRGNYLNIIMDEDSDQEEILININEIRDIEKLYDGEYIVQVNMINRGSQYDCYQELVCADEYTWKVFYEKIVRILSGD